MESQKFNFFLPDEIWEIILLEYVVDGEDLRNCCLALPYFDKLLGSSKPLWLFKRALGVFRFNNLLETNEKLNCRFVCKEWMFRINQFIYWKRNTYKNVESFHKFKTTADINRFMLHFDEFPSTKNPFVDHTVHLTNLNSSPHFPGLVMHLLHKFGHHVWILKMENLLENDTGQIYMFLNEALKMLPNLIRLNFYDDLNVVEGRNEQLILGGIIANNPLPFIPSLKYISAMVDGLPVPIWNMIMLSYTPNLKELITSIKDVSDFVFRGLTNLVHLHLVDISTCEELEKLFEINSPIEKLYIGYDGEWLSVSLLLCVLLNFPTLKDVTITTTRDFTLGFVYDEDWFKFKNSKLGKVFLFVNRAGRNYFNFLETFTNINTIIVGLEVDGDLEEFLGNSKAEGEGDVEIVRILREKNVFATTIWGILPTLKHLLVYDAKSGTEESRFEYEGARSELE